MEKNNSLQHLFLLVDNSMPSICYYKKESRDVNFMPLEIFKGGVLFAKSHFLNLTIIGDVTLLPAEYQACLKDSSYINIQRFQTNKRYEENDIIVLDYEHLKSFNYSYDNKITHLIVHFPVSDTKGLYSFIENNCSAFRKLSVIFDDINLANENMLNNIRLCFYKIYKLLITFLLDQKEVEIGFAFDRIVLKEMNNCDAGVKHITLAPDGNFYICPGFYYNSDSPVGNLETGILIPNKQLLEYKNAPICNHCDCYHCKRCVYLNHITTLEINTPSHNQCVLAHHERNLAGMLLSNLQERGYLLEIPPILPLYYLDPLELMQRKSSF